MSPPINWRHLSKEVDAVWNGKGRWSDEEARTALAILLGEEQLRAAVDIVMAHRSGSKLAQYVLQLLRPWVAMQRCYDRYRPSPHACCEFSRG